MVFYTLYSKTVGEIQPNLYGNQFVNIILWIVRLFYYLHRYTFVYIGIKLQTNLEQVK